MMSTLDAVFAALCASRQEVNQSGSVGAIVKAAVDIAGPHQTCSCRSRIALLPSQRARSRISVRRPVLGAAFAHDAGQH